MSQKREPEYYSGDGDCPHCHAIDALEYPVKGVVHWVVDGCTVHGVLDFRRCEACRQSSYCVALDIIRNPNVSDELTQEYFWSNKPRQGHTTVSTISPGWKIRGLPTEWRVYQTETLDGVIERHFFGPFPDDRKLWSPSDSSKEPWKHALRIICRVTKRLTRRTRRGH